MEVKNHDNAAAGRESEVKTVPSGTNEKVEESAAATKVKFDLMNEPGEAQHSKNNDESRGAETIAFEKPSLSNKKVIPELTLVLIGETNSIEIGSKNILIDHDEQRNVEHFSTKLYDLCGRHISVINMLGLPNIDEFPLNEEIHAFVMLLPNGLHTSHYKSGVQWLETTFGKALMAYVMTVVTHESDVTCESALTDLKANSSFVEKRYHTCRRSMTDEGEMIALLEKIDAMVSENAPHCHSGLMCDGNKGQKEQLEHKEERLESSLFQQSQTVEDIEENATATKVKCDTVTGPGDVENSKNDENTGESEITSLSSANNGKVDELEESEAKTENDPVNGAKHSDKYDDSIRVGGESEIKSVSSSATNKGEPDEDKEVNNESSSDVGERSMEESDVVKNTSPTSQTVSTVTKELDELEESADKTENDPVNGAKHSDKYEDIIRVGGESDIKSVSSSATNEGEPDEDKEVNNESSSDVGERSMAESDGVKNTIYPAVDELEESADKTENDPVNGAKHSDKYDDSIRVGGESEIKSVSSSATNKGEPDEDKEVNKVKNTSPTSQTVSPVTKELDELEESAAEAECDPVKRPADVKHSKNDGNTTVGGESEITPVQSAATEKGNKDMSGNMDKKSLEISEGIDRKKQYQRETEALLDRLQLQDKQQQKLSPADLFKVGPAVKQDHDTPEKDVAHTFIQKLMMLDYRARYIPVRQDSPEVSHSNPVGEFDTDDTEDDDLDALYSTNVDSDQSNLKTHVHPMDVQMAVFHCSDSFFKQNMITKLSQCQYALPLLVPDPVTMDIGCPLWTFRQIRKTWKITEMKDNSNIVTMKSMPICKAETPMVSFLRLGSPSLSKSELMNTLINNRHKTFFDRNCPGSTKSRHLMDGVAEIAWYCPAGTPNDAFTDCIAFCNLHGDALSLVKQHDILTDKSSVNVVLVPTLEQGDKNSAVISALHKSPKPLIILIADSDGGAVQMKKGNYKMGLNDKSLSKISEELKKIIGKILSGPHETFQLESMAEVSGVKVDEDDKACQKGKSAAMKMVDLLQGMEVSKIKDKYLPCQGQLWHEWCKINKELYHLKGNIENEKCKIQRKLMQIREEQCKVSSSEPMELFMKSLSSLSATEKDYFLKWTQILIDALSTDKLGSILQIYDKKWAEVLALKKKHDKSDLLKGKQTELDEISTKVQSATFGLEHIFREMGQIYEAHASLEKQPERGQTDWSQYPELAAELMISGHPMELMDGDAGQVPLKWISGLLDEVMKKLGDKRVFVLSVLGVQSSGKSTMLNAMFGLQFAVSAGRCTKGAFMQLVEVSEEIKKDFEFDYVLVVDTEGLRALELEGKATLRHDNELATFVVGLGNMTLINIFGENPADMQDVLQIVVQAFMRMKKIKLSPSCVFVHQNVTDIGATEKNMDGKRQLQKKLDKMTELAAKEEVCDAKCFSDVIAFDVQKDVKYFAQLWEGSPPMAPPNPGYSECVQELKTTILSKAKQSAGITLSQFKSKIDDLWNALMNEQFVFSFKNTFEIAVYRKLEVQYGNWTWTLRSNMLTIENELHTKIQNGNLHKVELNYLHQESNKTYDEIKQAMTTYFDDDGDKDMLVQWRGRFESKIKEFHDELLRGVQRKLDEIIQQKNACKKLNDKKTEFENNLLQKSKELAQQLKDKAKEEEEDEDEDEEEDEEELQKQFNSVWSGLVKELTAGIKPIEDINYEEDQSTVLQELGFEWTLIDVSKRSVKYKTIAEVGDYKHYVSLTKHHDDENDMETDTKGQKNPFKKAWDIVTEQTTKAEYYWKGYFQQEEQQLIGSLIDNVQKQSLDAIKSKPVATRGYSPTYLQEVANDIKQKVTEFESKRKYALKKEFTVDLLLYVFHRAERWLSESHMTFKGNNDAHSYVESKKMHHYNIFRSFCKGSSSAVVLGQLICDKLKSSTEEAVCNKTAIDFTQEMRCNCPAFNGNRSNLEKHLLKSLAEKEDFNGFLTYIQNPRKQAETYIREEVQKYISTGKGKEKALNILKKNVDDINTLVSQALYEATEKVKTHKGDPDMWMKEFSTLLKAKLTFNTISCQNFSDLNSFDFLKEEIEKGLVSIIKELSSLPLDNMKKFRMKPDEILINQLCDCCWVKCPFCAAVCTNTMNNHKEDHSVHFHRPDAVMGWHIVNTQDLSLDFCTTSITSSGSFHPNGNSEVVIPYKKYRTAGPNYANWAITPDGSKLEYWKWFVSRFEKDLEDHYGLKFQGYGRIPSEWKTPKDQAIKSLDK
ncbi:interferon-induced very large GTPase 1-like [Lycodopsis pacificus]